MIDNFVSSKDSVNWGEYCDEYFIPHFTNLFKNHPELSKKLLTNYRPPESLAFIDAVVAQAQPSPLKPIERRIIEIDSPNSNVYFFKKFLFNIVGHLIPNFCLFFSNKSIV